MTTIDKEESKFSELWQAKEREIFSVTWIKHNPTIMSIKLRVCALKYIYVCNVYIDLLKFIVKWLIIVRAFINEWRGLYFNVKHWTLISRWLSEKLTASNDILKQTR